jgi:threonine dehydrogenase-like Zn-dependent dehydrogenase
MIYEHPSDFARTIQLIASGKINPQKIISKRMNFTDISDALRIASEGADTKIMMTFD